MGFKKMGFLNRTILEAILVWAHRLKGRSLSIVGAADFLVILHDHALNNAPTKRNISVVVTVTNWKLKTS